MNSSTQDVIQSRKRGKADALRYAHSSLREPIATMRQDEQEARQAFNRAHAERDVDAAHELVDRLIFAKAWADEGERIQRAIVKRIEALGERL